MKETVLLAKILTIAKSSELFDQLRDLRQDMPMSFRNQASETVRSFGQRWLNLYKKVKKQRGESLSYKELEDVSHLLKKMVVLQVVGVEKRSRFSWNSDSGADRRAHSKYWFRFRNISEWRRI